MKVIRNLLIVCCLFISILYLNWTRWSLTVPQPLPQQSTQARDKSGRLLGGSYYEASIAPIKTDWYSSASYRLWLPDKVSMVRGLIVKQHGCGEQVAASGLDHANDLQWQALASKHKFALIGSKLSTGEQPCEFWADLNSGSEGAFLKALQGLAQKSNHPELKTAPWVLWGHSGGSEWAAQMLQRYPERTIAVVLMRCGGYYLIRNNASILKVPVLFAVGEKDPYVYDCIDVPKQVFLHQRKKDALWTFALEPNTAHEAGATRFFAIPYLDAMITARLPENSNKLRLINKTQGWLGDISTHKIASVEQYRGNPLETVWLPNEEIARKWQEYVIEGNVSPPRQPDAPTEVRATKISPTEVLIAWHFTPDLENGLPSFRIYRNNSVIQTLEGQSHNFGDAPKTPDINLEFKDVNAPVNSVYNVAAFNELGESLSQPISN